MKKLFYFLAIILVLAACDNELDLIEEWKDIPIVYGVVDPSDSAHYIRVEKAFVDDEISGLELAKNVDSIYYKDIEVVLMKGEASTEYVLERVIGDEEGFPRDSGAFASVPNILYKIKNSEINLNGNENLTLVLKRGNELPDVKAVTKTIGSYTFLRPRPDDPEKINLSYANHLTIRWNSALNAVDYEVYIIVHYEEKAKDAPVSDYVKKEVVWTAAKGIESNSVLLESKDFFTFLAGAIQADDNLVRSFDELEFRVVGVGEELSDYIAIGGANLGITASQEIPQYSNLSEGLGVFSTKWEISLDGLRITPASFDSIKAGIYTKHLNFE